MEGPKPGIKEGQELIGASLVRGFSMPARPRQAKLSPRPPLRVSGLFRPRPHLLFHELPRLHAHGASMHH